MIPAPYTCDLTALRQGNRSIFAEVYAQYAHQVYVLAFRFVKDSGWSEDIVQEVFVNLWKYRGKLDPQGNIWLFLYVLTKRQSLNKLREIRKSQESVEKLYTNMLVLDESTSDYLHAQELEEKIHQVINRLPPKQQQVFKLSRIDCLSHAEIAEELQISQNTVKNHIVEALKTLRKYLNQTDYTYFLFLYFL